MHENSTPKSRRNKAAGNHTYNTHSLQSTMYITLEIKNTFTDCYYHSQVTGTLRTKNVHQTPYQPLCTVCQQTVSLSTSTSTGQIHCTNFGKTTTFNFQPYLQCVIQIEDNILDCYLHRKLLDENFPELTRIHFN